MNSDYYDNLFQKERLIMEQYERERYEREQYGYSSDYDSERSAMIRHISYLEERCKRLEVYANRSNEEILYNMNIEVIEKYLRKKKLENLNKK